MSMQQLAGKKVLYVITKSSWGGATRYVYDLAVSARNNGAEVMVAAGGSGELVSRLLDAKIPFHQVGSLSRDVSLLQEFRAMRELMHLMRKTRPAVVHLNSSKAGLAAIAARMSGVHRILFTVHGWAWNENRSFLQKSLIALAYYFTVLLSHEVICVSEEARRQARWMPLMQKKFVVIYNGCAPQPLLAREEARASLFPSTPRKMWIGTIAELHPIKGLDVLIGAFEYLTVDYPDAELFILGEGQERGKLERLLTIEGVSGRAHLLGQVPEASRFLSAFDVFVLPSRSEALPYVLLEAGLAGLPTVATRVGGVAEIIENNVSGLLIAPDNRTELTDALEKMLADSSRAKSLGTALQERTREKFGMEKMIKETFALYKK